MHPRDLHDGMQHAAMAGTSGCMLETWAGQEVA